MRQHAAKDLRYTGSLIQPNGTDVVSSGIGMAVEDLTGRRLEQAQLVAAETSHMILLRYLDGKELPQRGYISVQDPDTLASTLYVVDYILDPRQPRPRVWIEVYCHVERAGN
jgi:hypothetical protein